MRVEFHTLGCKLNQFETEALAAAFAAEGHDVVGSDEDADLYVINTCTVTVRADHKARSLIRSVSGGHPNAAVIVTGCSAELEGEALSMLGGNVIVVSQKHKAALLETPGLLRGLAGAPASGLLAAVKAAVTSALGKRGADPFSFKAPIMSFHTRAYLKIQDGCNGRCAYCRVPLARGSSASMDWGGALEAAVDLESRGYREIVVTGVNISAYRSGAVPGAPSGTMTDLCALLQEMLRRTSRARLRLSSLEPEAVDGRLAEVVSASRICSHFHLPVQSGSDAVLARMRRKYTREKVAEAAVLLRGAKDDPFLAADIIVGFPGESERDFNDTMDLIRSVGFAALHVFPFSPRPGTEAARMDGQVPERERSRRAAELVALSRSLMESYQSRWIGRETEVLLERVPGGAGVTSNYLRVRVEGIPQDGLPHAGRIGRARIRSMDLADARKGCRGVFLGFCD